MKKIFITLGVLLVGCAAFVGYPNFAQFSGKARLFEVKKVFRDTVDQGIPFNKLGIKDLKLPETRIYAYAILPRCFGDTEKIDFIYPNHPQHADNELKIHNSGLKMYKKLCRFKKKPKLIAVCLHVGTLIPEIAILNEDKSFDLVQTPFTVINFWKKFFKIH